MTHRTLAVILTIFGLSGAAGEARAQFSQYLLPVEKAVLDSHAELQFSYARWDRTDFVGDAYALNTVILSAEGQVVFFDRLEVGLNIPFVRSRWFDDLPATASGADSTFFGDLIVALKGRILGGDTFCLSAFANTTLPTRSDLSALKRSRSYASLQLGGAASASFSGLTLGGTLEGVWGIQGDADDAFLIGVSVYGSYELMGLLHLALAMQYYNSLHPETEQNILGITPGVSVEILSRVRLGFAVRIAATDEANAAFLGRATVLFNGGVSF